MPATVVPGRNRVHDAAVQVVVDDREVRQIAWTPPARPYFADAGAGAWYPQAGLGTRPLSEDDDVLAWFAA
jgi:hypothetical protein